MRPIQDDDRGNGDAGCKRGRERALALQDRTLCFGGDRDRGAVPSLTVVHDRVIVPHGGRISRLAVRLPSPLSAVRRPLLRLALVPFARNWRRRFRLSPPSERDQLRDALFRFRIGVARPDRAVLALGDERRRRLAKTIVPVRTAFLRKPDRGLVVALGVLVSVMNVGVFGHGLGRDQTDTRVHRTNLPSEFMSPEDGGARREDEKEKSAAPTTRPPIGMSVPDSAVYLIETFDRNITATETFAAR